MRSDRKVIPTNARLHSYLLKSKVSKSMHDHVRIYITYVNKCMKKEYIIRFESRGPNRSQCMLVHCKIPKLIFLS